MVVGGRSETDTAMFDHHLFFLENKDPLYIKLFPKSTSDLRISDILG